MPRSPINSANASRQADHFWTQDHVDLLRLFAGQWLSMKEAAVALGCTKGMVSRKAERLKLTFHGYENFKRRNRAHWLRVKIEKLKAELARLETETPSPPIRVSRKTSEAA